MSGAGRRLAILLAGLLAMAPLVLRAEPPATESTQLPLTGAALAAAMTKYRQDLQNYLQAQQAYTAAASAYWSAIAQKRQLRNAKRAGRQPVELEDYVLDQPPA
jgi:hypothetical protein